ncbi:MAG: hypothetical protein NVS2B6_14170 [Thermoleophilaceae bacterium]
MTGGKPSSASRTITSSTRPSFSPARSTSGLRTRAERCSTGAATANKIRYSDDVRLKIREIPGSESKPQARLSRALDLRDSFWPAQVTTLAAIALYLSLPSKLTLGPAWLVPAFEGLLLGGLVLATPRRRSARSAPLRRFAMGLTGLVSAVNIISLYLLAHFLLHGGKAGGRPLIVAGMVLWVTNVLVFALWYWELDRGGPVLRRLRPQTLPDFLFPQMSSDNGSDWRPGFIDYLYVSFTNAAAFSPTDTMPLTPIAKSLMGIQSMVALVTIALVVGRAVNILS